jgi:phospholipid transport system substrate-binding protein
MWPIRSLSALLLLAACLLLAPPVRAATAEVEAFVQSIGDEAVQLLGKGVADPSARRETVDRLLHERFDLDAIARLSLGRFWRVASEEQRVEFLRLFSGFMTNLYANSLDRKPTDPPLVSGFVIDRVREEPAQDGSLEYAVASHFDRPAGLAVRVEWRVAGGANGGWRIADVSVEGLSMVVLFRQMLANVIQDAGGDVEGLLKRLRAMTGAGPAAPVPASQSQDGAS